MKLHYNLIFILVALSSFVSGCSTYRALQTNRYQREIDQAKFAMAQEDYSTAIKLYTDLSQKTLSPERDRYLRQAAEAHFHADEISNAKQTADKINPVNLVVEDRYRLRLLYGRIYLNLNKPDDTLDQLQPLPLRKLPADLRLDYHSQKARVFALLGNHLESAREQIKAEELLTASEQIDSSQTAILNELRQLSKLMLERLKPPRPDTLSGWMALTLILKETPADSPDFNRQIQKWQRKYPRHPANITRIRATARNQQQAFLSPASIGVLLPLSGPQAQVGEAIKQGILIAQSYKKNDSTNIHFYDTMSAESRSLYQKAIDDGAELVIGPLKKANLRQLSNTPGRPVPILGLNQITDLSDAKIYQFGLNPEDEVEETTNSAWYDGHHKAAIYVPSSKFGERMSNYYSEKWRQLGGEILSIETYNSGLSDYGPSLERLLKIHKSQNSDQQAEGSSDFELQARTEAEIIFLVALPAQARQIQPLLEYYQAGNIIVYSTSHLYGGSENPNRDLNLSGIVFCDIPWVLDKNIENNPPLDKVLRSWQHPATKFTRLMALGFDAYNLVPQLSALHSGKMSSYPGVTGKLTMTESNQIRRQLVCAEFEQGRPQLRTSSRRRN